MNNQWASSLGEGKTATMAGDLWLQGNKMQEGLWEISKFHNSIILLLKQTDKRSILYNNTHCMIDFIAGRFLKQIHKVSEQWKQNS